MINSRPKLLHTPKYSHVKRIILLCGKSKSGRDFIGTKLCEQLPGILLHVHKPLKNEPETLKQVQSSDIHQENTIK